MQKESSIWMTIRTSFKRSLVFLTVLYWLAMAAGCFQFRTPPKKAIKSFSKDSIPLVDGFVSTNGKRVHYVRTGSTDTTAPVVLFIHGSPGSSDNFFSNMKDSALRNDFTLISLDRLGFGYSEFGQTEVSLENHAQIIEPFLQEFRGRKIYLVGHSYGGPVVVKAAILYSKAIEGIVIVAGSVDPELEPHNWWRKPANFPPVRVFLPRSFNASNGEIIALKSELQSMSTNWNDISCHVYLLHGTEDKLVPYENIEFAKSKLTNAASVQINLVKGVNHFIPFLHEELIKKALYSF